MPSYPRQDQKTAVCARSAVRYRLQRWPTGFGSWKRASVTLKQRGKQPLQDGVQQPTLAPEDTTCHRARSTDGWLPTHRGVGQFRQF